MEDMKKLFQTNKNDYLAFLKISDSFTAVGLELFWNKYFSIGKYLFQNNSRRIKSSFKASCGNS